MLKILKIFFGHLLEPLTQRGTGRGEEELPARHRHLHHLRFCCFIFLFLQTRRKTTRTTTVVAATTTTRHRNANNGRAVWAHVSKVASDTCGRGWYVARDRRRPKGEGGGGTDTCAKFQNQRANLHFGPWN